MSEENPDDVWELEHALDMLGRALQYIAQLEGTLEPNSVPGLKDLYAHIQSDVTEASCAIGNFHKNREMTEETSMKADRNQSWDLDRWTCGTCKEGFATGPCDLTPKFCPHCGHRVAMARVTEWREPHDGDDQFAGMVGRSFEVKQVES